MENKIAYLKGIGHIEIEKGEMPVPRTDEVLVKLGAVGICGSDVHYFTHGRIGNYIVEFPFVLGHECAGTVVDVGEKVSDFKPGDRVALEPGVPCGKCEFCLTGAYNLCSGIAFMATPPYDGCYMNYVTHPTAFTFKLPNNMSFIEGALVEPLAIGINAALTGGVKLGYTVFISGAGCIGLVSLLAAKAYGASTIIVSDVFEKRLGLAAKFGAKTVNAKLGNAKEMIYELTGGRGADVVIDAVGASQTVQQSVKIVRRGGTIVIVGLTTPEVDKFPTNELIIKEATIKTIFRYKNLYPTAISAISNGQIKVCDIVSNKYKFNDIQRGFEETVANAADVVKSIIVF